MDLALEGIPGAADGSMTEAVFRQWQRYAARYGLPTRRLQLQLALIALVVAQSMGGSADAKLSDYLFDPRDESDDGDALAAALETFG